MRKEKAWFFFLVKLFDLNSEIPIEVVCSLGRPGTETILCSQGVVVLSYYYPYFLMQSITWVGESKQN